MHTAHFRRVYLTLDSICLSGDRDWVTRNKRKILIERGSHPHFDINSCRNYNLLGAIFDEVVLDSTSPNEKIVIEGRFDDKVGYLEYQPNSDVGRARSSIITVVLRTDQYNNLCLVTAYYGLKLDPSTRNKHYTKVVGYK